MEQEYSSLSMKERTQLVLLQAQRLSQREIARQMGRPPSTISRELTRNRQSKRGYPAATAQQQAGRRLRAYTARP